MRRGLTRSKVCEFTRAGVRLVDNWSVSPARELAEQGAAAQTAGARRAADCPTTAVERVLWLQRLAGNRAVAALLQRRVFEHDFAGDGQVAAASQDEFVLWNFDVGSAKLEKGHLDGIASVVQAIRDAVTADADTEVDIEGEASSTGGAASNDTLGLKRATAVSDELARQGVDAGRLRQISTGELKSRPEETQEGLARSRAVRVVIVRAGVSNPALTPSTSQPQMLVPLDVVGGKVTLATDAVAAGGGTVDLLSLRAGELATKDPGILVIASPLFKDRGAAKDAQRVFVQNVMPYREIVYSDGSRVNMRADKWHLDVSDPYPSQDMGVAITANDSPSMRVPKDDAHDVRTIEVRDHFRMFFVLRRPAGDTTVEVAEWTWVGLARNTSPGDPNPTFELDTTVSRVIPQTGSGRRVSDKPILSPHVFDLRFTADTGGLGGTAIAITQAAILNAQIARLRKRTGSAPPPDGGAEGGAQKLVAAPLGGPFPDPRLPPGVLPSSPDTPEAGSDPAA